MIRRITALLLPFLVCAKPGVVAVSWRRFGYRRLTQGRGIEETLELLEGILCAFGYDQSLKRLSLARYAANQR